MTLNDYFEVMGIVFGGLGLIFMAMITLYMTIVLINRGIDFFDELDGKHEN